MRLLYTTNHVDFEWTEDLIGDENLPPYAILSHTWQEGQEVTFDDLKHHLAKTKAGYEKISFCARQAERDGLRYFWVDTCCIDKKNNTELSEAINSMFRWYQKAEKCYVYLSDVSSTFEEDGPPNRKCKPEIRESRWFTRGWTLQELIAPTSVEFFSKERERLGDKVTLLQTLHERTGIAVEALQGKPLANFSVEERMSWAKGRTTQREEDAAYSLLGIFDIHMPLIYGEGRLKAYERLKRSIAERHFINLPIAKGASFDSHRQEHSARCLPNTRTALLHDIAKWAREDDSKRIFWLSGMAGTGKSTIARTAAESLARAGQLGASFFFKKGEGECGNASRFFSTITTGLVACEPGMLPGVQTAMEKDPSLCEKALKDQFENLILHPLMDINRSCSQTLARVIVIDALDECEREEDIRAILQLLSRTRDLSVPLRVLVTSRPELHIRLGFKQMSTGTYQDLVLHEVPKTMIEKDIRYFLVHEFDIIRQARLLSPNWPTTDQIQELVDLAVPLFIFAATVCRYIGTKGGDPETNLNKVLQYRKSTFSQLERTYRPVLDQLLNEQEDEDRDMWLHEFRELVGSIVLLQSPLPVSSLASLLQIPLRQIKCRLDALHSVLSVPDDEDVPVRILHLSFRDFLVDPGQQRKNPFWVDKKTIHEKLAFCCFELMSGPNGLGKDMCNFAKPGILRSEMDEGRITSRLSPELQYACRYWVDHLVRSQHNVTDGDVTDLFLHKHLLHWLEAMSLINESGQCIHLLTKLQALATIGTSNCERFLRDAKQFLLRFCSIFTAAPLQIYLSALVFAPEASTVRQVFAKQTSTAVKMLSGEESDWDACRSVLEGHADEVSAVSFSPDGKLIASASADKTVRIWEATGVCQSVLEGHIGWISSVSFSPDGKLVISASHDGTVRVWEVATGSCQSVLKGHTRKVAAISFSQDGKLIASASNDNTVRVWDAATGSCRSILEGHTDWVRAVSFSPDGKLLASASDGMTVRMWDAATGSCQSILKGHTDWISDVSFSPGGTLIISASRDKTVRVWDAATGSCQSVLEGHADEVSAVSFSPDGKLIASASNDKTVRIWDATGACQSVLEDHIGWVRAVSFSPDGKLIASASADKTVRVRDAATGSCQSVLEGHTGWINAVSFSPDGKLIVSASNDKTVRMWDAATSFSQSVLKGHTNEVRAISFSPDGKLIASASNDMAVRIWEATGFCKSVLEGHTDWVRAISFSPDGKLIASASDDKTVRVWNVVTGSCQTVLEGHIDWVRAVSFSPDMKLIASASDDTTVRLWDAVIGSCQSVLKGHTSNVTAISFSLDGKLIISASRDKMVRVWDAATGSCQSVLDGHTDSVRDVSLSPDGKLLASASDEKTVRTWEAETGSYHSWLEYHAPEVMPITFSLDGQYLRTDRGDILFPPPSALSPSSKTVQSSHIFLKEQWISLNEQRLCWLPSNYRPNCFAVYRDLICLGSLSGRVTILKVNVAQPRL